MIEFEIPGRRTYQIEHLVLDVNGTLACDGQLLEGVASRIDELRSHVNIYMLTADTHGRQHTIDSELGLEATRVTGGQEQAQKAAFVKKLGEASTCAIGNGANDAGMLAEAGLAIAVVGPEGLAIEALHGADIVVGNIDAALDLLLNPRRITATLRR
jgi:P-type E1-E2 ATPase